MELDRFDWLDLRIEAAIDPTRAIVDAHHHLWDRGGSTYLAPQLVADATTTHRVAATVFVECLTHYRKDGPDHLRPVGEIEFVAEQAAATDRGDGPLIKGIVGHADLMLAEAVGDVLEAQREAGGGAFRGIRHATSWHQSPEIRAGHSKPFESMMQTPQFTRGAQVLAGMGLTFDAWLFHTQLDELASLAAAVPDLSIILNHLGGPLGVGPYAGRRDEVRKEWQSGLRTVAAQPNVVLKLGGFGMDMYYGMDWSRQPAPPGSEQVAEHWGDDVRWCIDLFGPDRCLFESNFPVDRQSLPYPVLWNACQIMSSHLDDAEQDQLFSRTAMRVYNLR